MKNIIVALLFSLLLAFLFVKAAGAKTTIKTTYTLRSKYAVEPSRKVIPSPTPSPKLTTRLAVKAPVIVKSLPVGEIQQKVYEATVAAFGADHWEAMLNLINGESHFNPTAGNPSGAYGIFQFMPSTWASYGCEKTDDATEQIRCGIAYIQKRYGNPTNAWTFWQSRQPINGRDVGNWY